VLSLIDHTQRGYRPKNAVVVPAATGGWLAQPVTTHAQAEPGLLIYRFTHSMYYANAEQLSEQVQALVKDAQPPVSWFCIDGSAVDDVDFSAAATLRSIYASLKEQGIRLVFTEVMEDVRTESRYQLTKLVGEDAFFTTKDDVVTAFKQQRGSNPEPGDSES